jgi:predicted transcriptional regulator of viral defense system
MTGVARAIWTEMLLTSPVFTTREVAEAAGVRPSNASRDLARLEEVGMVTKVRRGLWAIPNHPDFSPYAVVPRLFSDDDEGYVSLLSALNLHGMIHQIPPVVHVMTTKQRADLVTPVGHYDFHQIQPDLFDGFGPYRETGNFDIATPEKALFDTLYLSTRKGQRFSHLPEIELPDTFSWVQLEEWTNRIELDPLRIAVRERWTALRESVSDLALA